MVTTTCDRCGGAFHWDWTEAFAKFGFDDGDGQVETWQVEDILTNFGYKVTIDQWGLHNFVTTSITKDGIELIPYDNSEYTFGYSDPRVYFPKTLVECLDGEFPITGGFEYIW